MLSIFSSQLPTDEATLRASLATYIAALAAHATTIDVPAPWPDFEILRNIVAAGGDFVVVVEPPPAAPPAPQLTPAELLAQQRAKIDADRDMQIATGIVSWSGKDWPIDTAFQLAITGFVTAFDSGILPSGATVAVRSDDNVTMQIGVTDLKALSAVVLAKVQAIWAASWAAKDALSTSTTQA
jgi:hypothetical protein